MTPNSQYLNLLGQVLTFSLWPEPPRPVTVIERNHLLPVKLACFADKILQKFGLRLCASVAITDEQRENGSPYWAWMAHTLVSHKRLRNIRKLCNDVVACQIEGSFVECGVWRGGASIYARACLPPDRKVILCDSFEGLPYDRNEPRYNSQNFLKVSEKEVLDNFTRYNLNYNVEVVKGYFKDTLHEINEPIAILRADADMYSSTTEILHSLYKRVSIGGSIIIDDYQLAPCRMAVENFCADVGLKPNLIKIDDHAVYWRKDREIYD